MENIDTLIASAQSVVDGLNAIKNAPQPTATPVTVTEVKVEESDGSEQIVGGNNA
jgi:hypothetical protein